MQANFLRTFLPDVEIASELIRDRLVEETALYRELEQFDPYSGNLLEYVEPQNTCDQVVLLFPSGETNRDLCECFLANLMLSTDCYAALSSINYKDSLEIVFTPSKEPIRTFSTPIQHIVASHGKGSLPNAYTRRLPLISLNMQKQTSLSALTALPNCSK